MKIKNTQIIILLDNEGKEIGRWKSANEAARALNVCTQTIYNLLADRPKYASYRVKGKLIAKSIKEEK